MVTTGAGATGFPGMAGMFGMGGTSAPNPYAGMNPYGGGMGAQGFAQMPPGIDPSNFMSQLGQSTPQAPTGAWATNPASAPPWLQAAMQSPGGIQGFLQNAQAQQLAAKQAGAMPQGQAMPAGPYGGILSGLMGGGFGPPRGMPRQQMPQQRPPARAQSPRRASYGGGSAGNISLSTY